MIDFRDEPSRGWSHSTRLADWWEPAALLIALGLVGLLGWLTGFGGIPGDFQRAVDDPALSGARVTESLWLQAQLVFYLSLGATVVLYLGIHRAFRPSEAGTIAHRAAAEPDLVGSRLVDADAWLPVCEEGEKPLALALVDEPEDLRPDALSTLSGFLLLLVTLQTIIGLAVLTASGSHLLDRFVLVAYAVVPLGGLALAAMAPGEWEFLGVGIGVALPSPAIAHMICPPATDAMAGDPAVLATAAVVVVGFVALLVRAVTRPHRLWLLTSRGLRRVEARGGEPASVGGPRPLERLTVRPGFSGSRWQVSGGEDGSWDVVPWVDEPGRLRDAAEAGGVTFEVVGEAGRAGAAGELRERPAWLLFPALLLVVIHLQLSLVHLGLHLRFGCVARLASSRQSERGARELIAACEENLEAFPAEPIPLCFRMLMEYELGEFDAARATAAELSRLHAARRYPSLAEVGQAYRLEEQLREGLEALDGYDGDHPPRGWEPAGVATVRFRRSTARLFGVLPVMWADVYTWPYRGLRGLAEEHPREPGPFLVLLRSFFDDDLRLGLVRGQEEGLSKYETDQTWLVALVATRERLDRLGKPLEEHAEWGALVRRTRGALPASCIDDVVTVVLREWWEEKSLAAVEGSLDALAGTRWLSVEGPPQQLLSLHQDPPGTLSELQAAWGRLEEELAAPDVERIELLKALAAAGDPAAVERALEEHRGIVEKVRRDVATAEQFQRSLEGLVGS